MPASELKEDYLFAVKKSIVDFVLKEPEIDEDERFLDEDDETPMTIELASKISSMNDPLSPSFCSHFTQPIDTLRPL